MPNLLLLKYNNYYNRTLKGYSNIDGYKIAVGTSGYAEVINVNFNPRDGISTYHTVNTNFDCDYMLVIESTQPWNIISRWFVIESHYDRADQRTLILRRDVLYDYSSSYGNAPAFIEKGALSASDPFIFNSEEMTFNQIYRSRQYIQDTTIRPWIVIYLAKVREELSIKLKINGMDDSKYISYTIKAELHSNSSGYDMICIPTTSTWTTNVDSKAYKSKSADIPFLIASSFSEAGSGGGVICDIQLLPYCPILKQSDWTVATNSATYTGDSIVDCMLPFSNVTGVNETEYPVLMRVESKDLQFVRTNIIYGRDIHTAIGMKVDSCTRFCRLVSPGGGSSFQFNAAKMWGPSEATQYTFNVKCTFMPYTPYIHIYPNFGGLYGISQDKDQRGLICGGDFSLPQVNDKWQTYQINNKNYQRIFDRQIENMEFNNRLDMLSNITGAVSGAVQGVAQGSMMSAGGASAGAVGASAAAAVIGGAVNIATNLAKRKEQMDYTKDMFGYNLQNIQALPSSIIKTSSYIIDSLVFPIFEIYTATEAEENALKNKIKYNGMSVGRIGTFNEFKSAATSDCRYVKCKIIRMDSLHEETSVANAIYSELNQGVFIS